MDHRFEYSIGYSERVLPGMVKLPPLVLQCFVENSIIHGIRHLEGKGHVDVSFDLEGDTLKCTIQDNGVGRKRAGELASNGPHGAKTSIAIDLAISRISGLRGGSGACGSVVYSDLMDETDRPLGTKVEITIPLP